MLNGCFIGILMKHQQAILIKHRKPGEIIKTSGVFNTTTTESESAAEHVVACIYAERATVLLSLECGRVGVTDG